MLKKTIAFGKIDYYHRGRKINKVTVDVRLYDNEDSKPILRISGAIQNATETDCVCCGQCLDEIARYFRNPFFKKIYGWWKNYHLNDMHLGTEEQVKYLESLGISTHADGYDEAVKALEKNGMLRDSDGKEYGTYHWWPIPDEVLNEIKEFINSND